MINEVELITGSSNISLNGIFRGKNLGSISSLNEYLSFRTAHGIDTKEYKDLYLGDYFTINDGTYNAQWMVAHFDYYENAGYYSNEGKGVLLIPRVPILQNGVGMLASLEEADMLSCYKGSLAYTTYCPAVATALQNILGSNLKTHNCYVSVGANKNMQSMHGSGMTGATTEYQRVNTLALYPSEVQIDGAGFASSSGLDHLDSCYKLAVFNFITPIQYGTYPFWTQSYATYGCFVRIDTTGYVHIGGSSTQIGIRPLIYIG